MLRTPFRWVRRRIEMARRCPRQIEIEAEMSQFFGYPVQLAPGPTKGGGGYDRIFHALRERQRFAVVRVNRPAPWQPEPIGPHDPCLPLDKRGRLDREWTAYERLSPSRLSPAPLWRSVDAIACTWLDGSRLSHLLVQQPERLWPLLEKALPAVAQMHRLGVVHLDLNLGNALAESDSGRIAFIDFEFVPAAWVDVPQQMAFDYLRLIDDCTRRRRGGRQLFGALDRLVGILEGSVDERAREAELAFALERLPRTSSQPELCRHLRRIFHRL